VEESIIDSTMNPQIQLNRDLSAFVFKHHGPDTLLIVYYAGHGFALPAEVNPAERDGFILSGLVKRAVIT
jgi:hypothetical protein